MAGISPYYVYTRTVKNRKYLYAKFTDRDGDIVLTTSVTALAHKLGYPKHTKITKRKEAERICSIALERGMIKTTKLRQSFIDFVKDYWDYEGKRVQRKIRLKPNSIGRMHE